MELERKKAALIRAAYYGMAVLAVVLAVRYLWRLALPLLLGFIIAYLLRPFVGFLCRYSRIGRRGAAIVSAIVFYGVIIALLWLLGALLYVQLQNAAVVLPQLYAETLRPALQDLNGYTMRLVGRFAVSQDNTGQIFEGMNQALEELVVSASGWLAGGITHALSALPMVALTMIFTILSSVLICVDYGEVTAFVMGRIPVRLHGTVFEIRDFLAGTVLKITKAYLILMVITFGELALGLWLLGINRFWLVAALIAVLDLLPVLGSGVVLLPWAVWALITGDYLLGGGLVVLWAIVSLVRQLVEPRLVSKQLGLHPLATLTAMYCGLRLAGFAGLILAPITCLLLKYLHDNGILKLPLQQK